jgi:CRP-like cAMP-binding protein
LRDAHRGQVLFSSSDPSDTLILVISGQVKVVVR